MPLYGDGGNVRDWLHVDDHCQGIELVRTRGRAGEVYNIGGGTELTNKELTAPAAGGVRRGLGTSVEYVADRKGHDRRYSVDCAKIREELGYAPRRSISPRGSRRPCSGTATTAPGGSRSRSVRPCERRLAGHRGGRDARPGRAGPARRWRGERATGLERAVLDVTDAGAVRRGAGGTPPARLWSTRPPGPRWTTRSPRRTRRSRSTAPGPASSRRGGRESGAVLLHVSTDYVFAGDATAPYAEDAPAAPRSAYGRTKAVGELAVREALPETGYVVRTAWLYGAGGRNFVRTMIRLEGVKESLGVVNDQRGQPTWTVDLADRLVRLGRAALDGTAPAGVYHGTSAGETTWFGLTREIFSLLGADPERVRPTTSAAFARPAPRPAYSVLGHERWRAAGIEPIRDWREALREAFPSLVEAERRAAAGPFTDR